MNKKVKKILNKTIWALAVVVLLSGCAKTDTKTVIKFSGWGSESEMAILKPIIKDFEQQNPNIKVNFIHIPKNYFQKLHLMVASNLTPDVIFLNNLNMPIYAKNGVLEDLNPYFKPDSIQKEDFFKKSLNAFESNNKLYAIPRDVSNLVIYYNQDLFDKYNVPYPSKDWAFCDYLSAAQKLTVDYNNDGKTDIYGVSFEENPLFWLPYLWSNGGGLLSQDLKKIEIQNEESVKSLQFYTDLRNKHHVAPTRSEKGSATMAQMFMQEKIAMHLSGRWNVPRYRKDIKFKWDIARFPRGSKGSIVDADASGWAMSKDSKHKKESWKFINFLASKNSILKMSKTGLIVPARIDCANSKEFLSGYNKPESSNIFIDIIPESVPTPVNENYQEITDTLDNALESVWIGKTEIKNVINDDLIKDLNKLVK